MSNIPLMQSACEIYKYAREICRTCVECVRHKFMEYNVT